MAGGDKKPIRLEPAPLLTPQRQRLARFLFLALAALLSSLWGERIPISDGAGWDGNYYCLAAIDPEQVVERARHEPYYAYRLQRILPSLVVRVGLQACGAELVQANVIIGFLVFNSALLLLGLAVWHRLSEALNLSLTAQWLGFLGLFCNCAVLKMAFYYPTMTDVSAMTLGLLLTYFYLLRKPGWLALTALLGSFTWHIAGIFSTVLLVFPCQLEPKETAPVSGRPPTAWGKIVATLLALAIVAVVANLYWQGIRWAGQGQVVPIFEDLFLVSLACLGFVVWLFVATMLREFDAAAVAAAWRTIRPRNVLLALAVLGLPRLVVRLLEAGEGTLIPLSKGLQATFLQAATLPAVFLVAHVAYYGPVLLLLAFTWKQAGAQVRAWGAGAILFALGTLVAFPYPESRISSMFIAPLVVTTVLAVDRLGLAQPRLLALLAPLSLLFSRVWLPFNVLRDGSSTRPVEPLAPLWDISRYYDSHGHFMSMPHYFTVLFAVTLSLFALSSLLGSDRSGQARRTQGRGASPGSSSTEGEGR